MDARMSWEDFRLVGAVAETGSLPAAARRLGVSHSTVFRRLGQVEATLGVPLFERGPGGLAPTPAGEEMTRVAEAMAEGVAGFAARLENREILPAGDLRVATSDALLMDLLTPLLADFRRAHPAVRLEVALSNPSLNLSRRDADVALRATDRPPETLAGRRVATLGWALYGAAGADASGQWVATSDDLADLPAARATRARVGEDRIGYRVNSVLALAEAIGAGAGVGFLPCFMGDARPGLARLEPPDPAHAVGLWLLVHPELQRAPRARAFLDFAAARLSGMRQFLEGAPPPGETPTGAAG